MVAISAGRERASPLLPELVVLSEVAETGCEVGEVVLDRNVEGGAMVDV